MTYNEILPAGKVLQQNSTHVAVKVDGKIKIYTKGFAIIDEAPLTIQPEYLYSVKNVDDLFALFEVYDENNRINFAELNS